MAPKAFASLFGFHPSYPPFLSLHYQIQVATRLLWPPPVLAIKPTKACLPTQLARLQHQTPWRPLRLLKLTSHWKRSWHPVRANARPASKSTLRASILCILYIYCTVVAATVRCLRGRRAAGPVVQALVRSRRVVRQSAGHALREGVPKAHTTRPARIHLARCRAALTKEAHCSGGPTQLQSHSCLVQRSRVTIRRQGNGIH